MNTMKDQLKPLLTLLLLCTSLIAHTNAMAIELSDKVIDSWIKSQSGLEEWGKTNQANFESETSADQSSPTSMTPQDMIAPLKSAGLYDSANKLVQSYGFSSIDEWAEITLRITKAAAAIEFKAHPEMMDSSQLDALRNSEDLSPEHKKMLSEAIEQNQAIVKDILDNANETDIQAVEPHLERILQMMEEPY